MIKAVGLAAIVAVSMVGCNGAAIQSHPGLVSANGDAGAGLLATKTEQALAKRDFAVALANAESAVAAKPDSADYRALLGRTYLANGRFQSARTAFEDAMTLGSVDTRTIVSLALVRVAQGDNAAAHQLLIDQADHLPASDYGLAMAVSGDPQEAIRVLSQAIHDPSADAKTRQNLAYAYALAGQWREASMMASQDLTPADAAKRVLVWAQTSQPGAEPQRVAALTGVVPVADDSGMPTRLALAPATSAVQTAEATMPAAPEPVAAVEDPASVEIASADVATMKADPFADAPVSAPVPSLKRASLQLDLPSQAAEETVETMKPALRRIAWVKPVGPNSASNWVVQLAAYSSADVAKAGWDRLSKKNAALSAFPVVNSTAMVNGKMFHRVAISGFSSRAEADKLCDTIRAQSGQCFIREGGAEVKSSIWAAYKGRQLAFR